MRADKGYRNTNDRDLAPRLHRPERFQMIPGADTSPARLAGKMREKEVASQTIRTPARRAASQWRRSWMRRAGQPRSGAHAAPLGGEHSPRNPKPPDKSHIS